jgi:aspartyl-tRNA(Asn)/glutamyl-tRNA(Gln) amidotransferase subunit B
VEAIRAGMVEPPYIREKRLIEQYGIEPAAASVIVSERELADLFEAVAKEINPKLAATWFRTKLKKVLNYMKLRAADVGFTPQQIVGLLRMVDEGEITPEQGELVLRELVRQPGDPRELLRKLGLERLRPSELRGAVAEVIRTNRKAVEDYLAGKEEALHFLAGKVMKLTHGRADPRKIIELLRSKIVEK